MNTQGDENKSVSGDVTQRAVVTQSQGTPTPTTASTEAPLSTTSTVDSTSMAARFSVAFEDSPCGKSPKADEDGTNQMISTQGSPKKYDEISEVLAYHSARNTSNELDVKLPASKQESKTNDNDDQDMFKRRELVNDEDVDEVRKKFFEDQLGRYRMKQDEVYTNVNTTSNDIGVDESGKRKRERKPPPRYSPISSTEKHSSMNKDKTTNPNDPSDDPYSSDEDESSEDSDSGSSEDTKEEATPPKKKPRKKDANKRKKSSKKKPLGQGKSMGKGKKDKEEYIDSTSDKKKSTGKGKKNKEEYIDSTSDRFIGGVYSYIQNNESMAEIYSYTMSNIGKNGTKEMLNYLLNTHADIFCDVANVCTREQFLTFSKDVKNEAESLRVKKLGVDTREKRWKHYVRSKAVENPDAHDALPYNMVITQFQAAWGLRVHKALLNEKNGGDSQWVLVDKEKDFKKLFSGTSPFLPQLTADDRIDPIHKIEDKREIAPGFPSRYSDGNNLCKKYNNHKHVTSYEILKREGIDFLYLFGVKEVWQRKMVDSAHPVPKKKKIVNDGGLNCKFGDILYLDGRDTRLWGKCVYFVGAYKFVNGMKQDKVGYVKSLHLDLEMITNRFVQVVDGDGDVFGIEQGDILRVKFIER